MNQENLSGKGCGNGIGDALRKRVFTVQVHLFDDPRSRVRQSRVEVKLKPGNTVGDLFHQMAEEYDERFGEVCVPTEREPAICVVILNGRSLKLPRDLQKELSAGDELYLIPPIAGGYGNGPRW